MIKTTKGMNEKEIRSLIQAAHIYPNVHVTMRNLERLAEAAVNIIKENEGLKMQIREIKFSPGMKVCVIKEFGDKSMAFVDVQKPISHKIYTGIIKFTEFDPETHEFLITVDGIAGKYEEGDVYYSFAEAKGVLDNKISELGGYEPVELQE